MSQYRIGLIDEQWRNLTPPIRGGTFRKAGQAGDLQVGGQGEKRGVEKDLEDDTPFPEPVYSSSTDPLGEQCRFRVDDTDTGGASRDKDAPKLAPAASSLKSRDARISDAVQAEVDKCLSDYPSPDFETQTAITAKYRALHERVHTEGFYVCDYRNYVNDALRCGILFSLFVISLYGGWYLTSALFLGFFWQQIMFTAHDAGHRGITHRFVADTLIGIFIADFCCGLSIGWWKSSHNVHHLVTNSPEHDPDIQNTPLFATCPSQFSDTLSTYYSFTFGWDKACEALVPYQKYTYYPIMAVARFNLYLLSWCHLLSPRSRLLGTAAWIRPVEIVAMCCYWYLFGYVLLLTILPDWPTRVAFVLISHTSTMVLHVQITLSHWGMSTCDLGNDESFAQRQMRTTMDVECPSWLDWVHGGLQFQAIHHLFPRVPRHNLRKLQPLVKEFCAERGIHYSIQGFASSNGRVLNRLNDISNQLALLGRCYEHMAVAGESGLH